MAETPAIPPSGVRTVTLEGRTFHLLGTAHVSAKSVEDVRAAAAALRPDDIAIELCQPRYDGMRSRQAWRETDLFRVIREKKTAFLLAQLLLQSFYRRLGKHLEIQPGAEMMAAADCAQASGARLALVDRRIDLTLKRVWRHLSFWNKCRLGFSLFASLFADEKVDAADIESLKDSDRLDAMLEELGRAYPAVKTYLLDERDVYLAQKLRRLPGPVVLAVVGAGHVEGIVRSIREEIPLEPLETLPPPSRWSKIWPWLLPAAVVALVAWSFWAKGLQRGIDSIVVWTAVNAAAAALGALAALAHPLTVLAAAVAAPFTSLNPAIAAGWVAGLVETWLRPPVVADFESLPGALETFRSFWRNPVIRILLVVVLVNLGSTLGTLVAIPWIAAR